ncbi:hypothetical protein [Methylobacterium radiotolerans]|uniref:hypothetical protein n=1 Tax=Methylobacterium radiotolerans TaxID=31998 RepID=UPI0038D1EE01
MSDDIRYFDCGDCPLYGGCARVCAHALARPEPVSAHRARDLFEAAELVAAAERPTPQPGSPPPAYGFDERITS